MYTQTIAHFRNHSQAKVEWLWQKFQNTQKKFQFIWFIDYWVQDIWQMKVMNVDAWGLFQFVFKTLTPSFAFLRTAQLISVNWTSSICVFCLSSSVFSAGKVRDGITEERTLKISNSENFKPRERRREIERTSRTKNKDVSRHMIYFQHWTWGKQKKFRYQCTNGFI